jgi:methyl-accepting chemotaxis protein
MIIKILRRMSVGKRLATGFGLVLALMAALIGVALYGFSELHQINQRLAQQSKGLAVTSADIYGTLRAAVLIIGTLAAVVAIFFSKRVAQMITRPITRAATVSDGIAQGNLAQKIDVNHHGGELGLLLNSIQNTIYRLRELIQAVRDRAEVVQNGTDEIARGNAELSSRTEQQASTLEETASSMEEFTASVKQNAENANHA